MIRLETVTSDVFSVVVLHPRVDSRRWVIRGTVDSSRCAAPGDLVYDTMAYKMSVRRAGAEVMLFKLVGKAPMGMVIASWLEHSDDPSRRRLFKVLWFRAVDEVPDSVINAASVIG